MLRRQKLSLWEPKLKYNLVIEKNVNYNFFVLKDLNH
jgi:hypothetical protein